MAAAQRPPAGGLDRIKAPKASRPRPGEAVEPTSSRAALFSTPGEPVPTREPDGRGATPRRHRPEVGSRPAPPADVAPDERVDDAVDDAAEDDGGSGLLRVECGHCGDVCPMPLTTAIRRALPVAVVAPWRSHPVFAVCPCGQRRAWLKPKLGLPKL